MKKLKFKYNIGDVFNYYTVINNEVVRVNNKTKVLCRCRCGNERLVRTDNLIDGTSKSCGCLCVEIIRQRSDKLYEDTKGKSGPFRHLLEAYVRTARNKNLPWELSEDFVFQITQKNCYYCNIVPSQVRRMNKHVYIFNGIDRVDNELGYTTNNTVPCCSTCNTMKMNKTQKDFLQQVLNIFKFNNL